MEVTKFQMPPVSGTGALMKMVTLGYRCGVIPAEGFIRCRARQDMQPGPNDYQDRI